MRNSTLTLFLGGLHSGGHSGRKFVLVSRGSIFERLEIGILRDICIIINAVISIMIMLHSTFSDPTDTTILQVKDPTAFSCPSYPIGLKF